MSYYGNAVAERLVHLTLHASPIAERCDRHEALPVIRREVLDKPEHREALFFAKLAQAIGHFAADNEGLSIGDSFPI